MNVTRKADWTFLNNLATFVGFLFSYFHRFTIGIAAQVIILGPFTSQVAVTSIHGGQTLQRPLHSVIVVNVREKWNILEHQQISTNRPEFSTLYRGNYQLLMLTSTSWIENSVLSIQNSVYIWSYKYLFINILSGLSG